MRRSRARVVSVALAFLSGYSRGLDEGGRERTEVSFAESW